MSHISGRAGWWKHPSPVLVRASGEQSPGATRQDPEGWGGLARTSRDPPQEPHYRDAVEGPSHIQDERSRGERAGLQPALVRRGDVTVWVSSEAIAAWTPRRSGRRGGQRRYSDLAIETAMTLRLLYHLPLRQAEGFLHALFGMMRLDLSAPD